MNREGHEDTKFFYGTEVEHTPALGKKTLFVVGVQTTNDIAAHLQGCEHIYFGANQSFPNLAINDADAWWAWEDMITTFLKKDYLCTLDIDVQCVEGLLESGLCERHNFIPMISVKLPYIHQLGYNSVLKIDDKDFAATNPGVWCHSIHELQKRDHFTDWSKYTKDKTL
jgi:hypothetical protein